MPSKEFDEDDGYATKYGIVYINQLPHELRSACASVNDSTKDDLHKALDCWAKALWLIKRV